MRWEGGRRSDNIDDLRGAGVPRAAGVGPLLLLRLIPLLLRTRGGRWLLVIGVVGFFGARLLGIDPLALLQQSPTAADAARRAPQVSPAERQRADFVSAVLASTEDAWAARFNAMGRRYRDPRLVLFRDAVRSACGLADAAVGPFYCPADQKVYLDLSFFDDLSQRLGAPGDFAQAYVIAHEVGHHVQNLLGVHTRVEAEGRGMDAAGRNRLSVRVELQADCFAGLWGAYANRDREVLEPGDLEEALTAASAIGDDRLQREARGTVVPDSFTHGTSAQRVYWFRRGFESGDFSACDAFAAAKP